MSISKFLRKIIYCIIPAEHLVNMRRSILMDRIRCFAGNSLAKFNTFFFQREKQTGCATLLCKKKENHFIMSSKLRNQVFTPMSSRGRLSGLLRS